MSKNEPFKYMGDDYLLLHDSLNKLNKVEQVIFNMNNGGILIGTKEIQYMIGGDKILRNSAEYFMGINRVINSNPEKYKKIYSCQDPRYKYPRRIPIMLPENPEINNNHSYIN
jgi:hypothetical protein